MIYFNNNNLQQIGVCVCVHLCVILTNMTVSVKFMSNYIVKQNKNIYKKIEFNISIEIII